MSPIEVIAMTMKYNIKPIQPVNPKIPEIAPPIIDKNVRLQMKPQCSSQVLAFNTQLLVSPLNVNTDMPVIYNFHVILQILCSKS